MGVGFDTHFCNTVPYSGNISATNRCSDIHLTNAILNCFLHRFDGNAGAPMQHKRNFRKGFVNSGQQGKVENWLCLIKSMLISNGGLSS